MGCVTSKKTRSESPISDATSFSLTNSSRNNRKRHVASPAPLHVQAAFGPLEKIKEEPDKEIEVEEDDEEDKKEENVKRRNRFKDHSGDLSALKGGASEKKASFSIKFGRLTESEHVVAGWPIWLSAVAGEAIEGWLPLKSETFQRLEKIGRGTYSDVYRARNRETGKMVALKKIRFENFQPESVRFMSREILILRKLDHPNIMKLRGIVSSRMSCSIYLVFEYMEHDLAGLVSCPDIKFTDSQIKCYMRQLLSGLEHCHSRGVMHRDIKTSNILVNNEGILKIGDFGLANFMRPKNKQPLTSRVVTLWYRPPELLLGSTNYSETVDLWSVGCVFAEFFTGRPLFKGRTEVEQLHKIFKLCGSPSEDYWKRSRLPLATMFKPQHPYESTLREKCREFPKSAVDLIETFLSIESSKRGTTSSALDSEYFNTKPYASEPSSFPKYPPNKEIDAKFRQDERRKNVSATSNAQAGLRNPRRVRRTLYESSDFSKVVPTEVVEARVQVTHRNHSGNTNMNRKGNGLDSRTSLKQTYDDTVSEASQMTHESQGSTIRSVPVEVNASTALASKKRQKPIDVFTRLYSQQSSRLRKSSTLEPSTILHVYDTMYSDGQENDDSVGRVGRVEATKRDMRREQVHLPDRDSSDVSKPQEVSTDNGHKKKDKVRFSEPLIRKSQEMASKRHGQHFQSHNRSRFYKGIEEEEEEER